MIYVGIDPGLDGAIAALDDKGVVLDVIDTSTVTMGKGREYNVPCMLGDLKNIAHRFEDAMNVGLEYSQPMPSRVGKVKMGAKSAWRQGVGYALWWGIVVACYYPLNRVPAREWTKIMLSGLPKLKRKSGKDGRSIIRALELFPTVNLKGPGGGTKDGRADALLIAEYLRRTSGRQQ